MARIRRRTRLLQRFHEHLSQLKRPLKAVANEFYQTHATRTQCFVDRFCRSQLRSATILNKDRMPFVSRTLTAHGHEPTHVVSLSENMLRRSAREIVDFDHLSVDAAEHTIGHLSQGGLQLRDLT